MLPVRAPHVHRAWSVPAHPLRAARRDAHQHRRRLAEPRWVRRRRLLACAFSHRSCHHPAHPTQAISIATCGSSSCALCRVARRYGKACGGCTRSRTNHHRCRRRRDSHMETGCRAADLVEVSDSQGQGQAASYTLVCLHRGSWTVALSSFLGCAAFGSKGCLVCGRLMAVSVS